jgi:hypothetical protein
MAAPPRRFTPIPRERALTTQSMGKVLALLRKGGCPPRTNRGHSFVLFQQATPRNNDATGAMSCVLLRSGRGLYRWATFVSGLPGNLGRVLLAHRTIIRLRRRTALAARLTRKSGAGILSTRDGRLCPCARGGGLRRSRSRYDGKSNSPPKQPQHGELPTVRHQKQKPGKCCLHTVSPETLSRATSFLGRSQTLTRPAA